RGEFLVAEVDGEVAAMGAIRRVDDATAEIKRIRVDPRNRRQGLGDLILRALEERATDLGYRRLVLDTAADATSARGLFEKHGFEEGNVGWRLDPIDGTKQSAGGIPIRATLIALERIGETVVAVVSAPALGHRWWAERGGGAFLDGKSIRVSRVARLEDAYVS